MKKTLSCVALASVLCSSAFAIGGPSGAKLDYAITGAIGEVVVNPYDTAPLTAVIKNGGYTLSNAKVTIVPKQGGQVISYKIGPKEQKSLRKFFKEHRFLREVK